MCTSRRMYACTRMQYMYTGREIERERDAPAPRTTSDHGVQASIKIPAEKDMEGPNSDSTSLMQRGRGRGRSEPLPQPAQPQAHPAPQQSTEWMAVENNFAGGFTLEGVSALLERILQSLLEQTFHQPSEYATQLAYHACFYLRKLRELQQAGSADPRPVPVQPEPTDFQFNIHNPLIEAEATLNHLADHHENLPRRHVQRELMRAEALIKEGRALFKGWANDPQAPGALPGTAATRNTLDAIDWALLATEEGGVANMDDAIRMAASAAQRSSTFMTELIQWLREKFTVREQEGSPSPKKARREIATGSTQPPKFQSTQDEQRRLHERGDHREQASTSPPCTLK